MNIFFTHRAKQIPYSRFIQDGNVRCIRLRTSAAGKQLERTLLLFCPCWLVHCLPRYSALIVSFIFIFIIRINLYNCCLYILWFGDFVFTFVCQVHV